MKKVKFYFVFSLIVVFISVIGILLGMVLVTIEQKHPEYLSAGIFKGIIIFFMALLVTVCFHELAHAIAFKLQRIDIRMIAIFPICLIREKEGLKFHIAISMEIGFGGIVIPEIPTISNQTEYESFQGKMRVSLVSAPLCSAFIGLISLILVLCTTKYIGNDFCSYYFLFFSAVFLWSVYINLTSMLDLGSIVGDYSAVKKIKDNNGYALLQIYNYFLLQENEKKFEMRENQRYFIEKLYETGNNLSLDKEDNSINVLLINAVLYESLMRRNRDNTEIINFDTDLWKRNIHNILNRLQFEAYFQTFSHAVICMHYNGKSEEALELWEKYKDKMPSTNVGKYNSKQVELFLCGKNIEELKEKTGSPVIPVSVVEETGISQLEDEIKRMFFHGELSFNDEVYITNARHKAALEESKESLKLVMDSIAMGMSEDFFSIDLMNAYESLGRIVGESVGEDLVNEIFSKFCVGK